MRPLAIDLYPLLRPILFYMDAEKVHELAIKFLKKGYVPAAPLNADEILKSSFKDIDFPHPLGLAAGFDKNGDVIPEMLELGFSFTEIGGVTPLPQDGNPKPRLFRLPHEKALINRFGFNSQGSDVVVRHLAAYRDTQTRAIRRNIVGVNLGKNRDSEDAIGDYVKGVKTFAPYADFLTVNISSPNTPGLRDLQERGALTELLGKVKEARAEIKAAALLLIKISPDVTDQQAADIAAVAVESNIDGMIVGNTTVSRSGVISKALAEEKGGLSGQPLFPLSTQLLGKMYKLTDGKIPMIGVGGVFSGADAYAKIRAGASLIQIYTSLIYRGPHVISTITSELAALLRRDGFASVIDAVGADHRK